jgi:hypothetical protein
MWPAPSVHRVGARNSGFRGSIAPPTSASVNASPAMSPPPAHDSRSAWFATPSLVGLLHPRLPAGLSRRFLTAAHLTKRSRLGAALTGHGPLNPGPPEQGERNGTSPENMTGRRWGVGPL